MAHLLAVAVLEKFPGTQLGTGPIIENGFYYDFGNIKISDRELKELEKRMRELIKQNLQFKKSVILPAEAKKFFKSQPYKLEIIEELRRAKKLITIYKTLDLKTKKEFFVDLCAGPHIKSTAEISLDGFVLERTSGAYWKGKEENPALVRIYGLAFSGKRELEAYQQMLEEIKKRDHKKLGPQLDLFAFSELVGSGLPLWTPKGTLVRNLLDDFVWKLRGEAGYNQVDIPHITKKDLYEKSGHWDKFKDELFKIETREGHFFALKPMNCPHHTQIYARHPHTYKELPQRYANTTKVYRDEQSGELAGLARVRAITQDDAHVFCRKSQVKEEMGKIWDIIKRFYGAFGFNLYVRLSLSDPKQPKKYLGKPEAWKVAESQLRALIKERKSKAVEAKGEAAFYGPKIDFMAKDSLGREWQLATIQLDMNMPERFDLYCINEKGEKERIVMIHAAIMGSIERYLSILIEHYAGNFPVWLAPVQVAVLNIGLGQLSYVQEVCDLLKAASIRAEIFSEDSLGKRIREAELQKIPYILIAGDKEIQNNTVSVRHYKRGQEGEIKRAKLIERIKEEIQRKD